MGVKDLWQLLAPIGRRVSVETLEGKTLAIDASIWITQFIKAMRDEEGKMMKNAHLIGTLRRVLKLLFHRIKPLFVFDGATPTLKLRVVQARRKNQDKQEENKRVAAMRLLRTQLKQYAEEQPKASSVVKTTALAASVDDSSSKFVSSFKPGGGQGALTASAAIVTTDTSACAPRLSHPPAGAGSADTGGDSDVEWVDGYESLQSKSLVGGSSSSSSSLRREQYQHQHQQEDQLQWQLPENSADLSPEVLAALPAHIRKSLVEEARRRQRMESRAHYLPVAGNPALYSQTQLSNFLNSSKLNRKFVDAQLSAEGSSGSAGLGSKIAAEGSKMYRFLPNVSTTSAFASDAIAFTGTAEAGGAGSSSASSSGFSAAAAAADATADDEDEEEGYWEPASIADDPGDHSSMKSSAGVAQTVTVEEGAGCCSSGIAATAMGMAMQEKEKEKEGQEREQEERLLRGHVVDGSASASADGGTDGGAQQQEVFCLYDSDSSAEDEGAAATATATASGEQDKTSEGEGADAGADGDEVAWESASEPKSESESVEVADSDSDIVEDALVDGDEGEGGEAVDVAPVACAWPSGMRAGVLADDACAESPLSSLIGSNSNYAAPSWDSTVIDRDVLDRAMQTAASMADWAGRAVRSALRGHQHATATATTCIAVAGGSPSATSGSTMAAAGAVVGSPDPTGTARESTSAPTDIAKHSLGMSGAGTAGNLCDNEADVDLTQTGARVAAAAVAREEEQEDEEVQEEPEQDEEFRLQQEGPEEQEKREVDVRDARRRFNNAMRDTESLTEEMREEVILLLQALNLPYLIAPYEAEAQCAVLEQLGLVDGVVTEDSDALLFGARTVYKNIFSDKKFVEVYLAEDARLELGLHREDLVALAYFLGSDYAEGVTGVGIVNAVEIVHAFPMHGHSTGTGTGTGSGSSRQQASLQGVGSEAAGAVAAAATAVAGAAAGPLQGLRRFKEWLQGFDLHSELLLSATAPNTSSTAAATGDSTGGGGVDAKLLQFTQKHRSGRSRWSVPDSFPDPLVARAYLQPAAQYSTEPFAWSVPPRGPVRRFCSDRLGWTDAQMDLMIDPVLKRFAERNTQTRIDAHFLTYHGDTRFAKIASDRLREAVVQITGKRSSALALGVTTTATSTTTSKPDRKAAKKAAAAAAGGAGSVAAGKASRRRSATSTSAAPDKNKGGDHVEEKEKETETEEEEGEGEEVQLRERPAKRRRRAAAAV